MVPLKISYIFVSTKFPSFTKMQNHVQVTSKNARGGGKGYDCKVREYRAMSVERERTTAGGVAQWEVLV